jgi:hypothetical protein
MHRIEVVVAMRKSMMRGLARLAMIVSLVGLGLVAVVSGAGTASAAPPLVFNVNGSWTDNGSAQPSIIQSGSSVVVNMSYAHRPTAFGNVVDATTIVVRFPDAGTITGTLQGTGTIRWNNGSSWQKVFSGALVHDVNGTWTDGVSTQNMSNIGGYIRVVFQNGRPTAVGFARDATTIQVTFPDNATYLATVDPSGYLFWSNRTVWQHPILH